MEELLELEELFGFDELLFGFDELLFGFDDVLEFCDCDELSPKASFISWVADEVCEGLELSFLEEVSSAEEDEILPIFSLAFPFSEELICELVSAFFWQAVKLKI